jgi:hypothetical protein
VRENINQPESAPASVFKCFSSARVSRAMAPDFNTSEGALGAVAVELREG